MLLSIQNDQDLGKRHYNISWDTRLEILRSTHLINLMLYPYRSDNGCLCACILYKHLLRALSCFQLLRPLNTESIATLFVIEFPSVIFFEVYSHL